MRLLSTKRSGHVQQLSTLMALTSASFQMKTSCVTCVCTLLRHGANRVLWGCDIGVALETRPDIFDWDLVLRGSERERNWVVDCLALASEFARSKTRRDSHQVWQLTLYRRGLSHLVLAEWGKVYQFPAPLALFAGQSATGCYVNFRSTCPMELWRRSTSIGSSRTARR